MASALHIYLQDHLAGATFGLQLVQRCQRNNGGSELAEPLVKLTAEIAEDRRTLQEIMRDVGAERANAENQSENGRFSREQTLQELPGGVGAGGTG